MASEAYLVGVLSAVVWSLSMVGLKLGLEEGGTCLQASLVVAFTDVVIYWGLLVALGRVGAFVLAGAVGTALGRFASFTGIHRVGAGVNSAGISTRPLFATALAFLLIDEVVAPQVVGGILLLVAGLVVLSLSRGGDVDGWRAYELLFPLSAAGRSHSRTSSGGGAHDDHRDTPPRCRAERDRGRNTTRRVRPHPTAGCDGRGLARTYAIFVGSGVLNALSLLVFFVALDLGQVAIASSLIATTPLFTAAFAYVLLDDLERITRGVVAGAVLVVVGAVVITLA